MYSLWEFEIGAATFESTLTTSSKIFSHIRVIYERFQVGTKEFGVKV